MTAWLTAAFAASLTGSLHCAAMCGGFVFFGTGGDEGNSRARLAPQLAYNFGRMTVYVAYGALAGLSGSGLDMAARAAGFAPLAAVLAGATIALVGGIELARFAGLKLTTPRVASRLAQAMAPALRRVKALPPLKRALTVGWLTALLPCGWLWAFVLAAAATASPLNGAALMFAFWLGTLPALLAVGIGLRVLTAPLARFAPAAMAVLSLAAGLTLVGLRTHWTPPPAAAALAQGAPTADPGALTPSCHHGE